MNKLKNISSNLRKRDVIDIKTSIAADLPASANQIRLLNERLMIGVPVVPVVGTVSLGLATQPTAGDTITIGTETYTIVVTAEGDFDVALGIDIAATQGALKAVIDGNSTLVTSGSWGANALAITAKVKGVVGNMAVSTALADGTDAFDTATLVGGIDGTVALALTFMLDATAHKLWVSEAESTTAESNWKSTALT